jgi:hypothetical protein
MKVSFNKGLIVLSVFVSLVSIFYNSVPTLFASLIIGALGIGLSVLDNIFAPKVVTKTELDKIHDEMELERARGLLIEMKYQIAQGQAKRDAASMRTPNESKFIF